MAIPKVAISPGMSREGLKVLAAMTEEGAEAATDIELVNNIFYNIWLAYWEEIEEMKRRKKRPGGMIMASPPKLILPGKPN